MLVQWLRPVIPVLGRQSKRTKSLRPAWFTRSAMAAKQDCFKKPEKNKEKRIIVEIVNGQLIPLSW